METNICFTGLPNFIPPTPYFPTSTLIQACYTVASFNPYIQDFMRRILPL